MAVGKKTFTILTGVFLLLCYAAVIFTVSDGKSLFDDVNGHEINCKVQAAIGGPYC